MTAAIVQAQPAAMQRYSAASTASLAPVDDAIGHYRRALGAFLSSRNDLPTPALADASASLAGEVTTLVTLDAVPGRIAATLVGADAAPGVALAGPPRARRGVVVSGPPLAQRGVVSAPIDLPMSRDGVLMPWPDPRLARRLGEGYADLQDDPRWRAFRDGLLGPFLLPSDLLTTPLGRSLRRWWDAPPQSGSVGGLGRLVRIAGPLGVVVGLIDLPHNVRTLRHGSGNDGARGVADRVVAGLSIGVTVSVAGGLLLAAAASPVGWKIVGVASTVGAGITVWTFGTLAWDHREQIARERLGRADRRGQQVERVGEGLRTAGEHLRPMSTVVGTGIRVGSERVGDHLEGNAEGLRDAGDGLAQLQRDLADRIEDHAREHGPIAEHVAERVGDRLEDGARTATVAGAATHAVGSTLADGVRTVGGAADRTIRRTGRRAAEGLQETGERVSDAGTRIRKGIRDVGSWLGLDEGGQPAGAGA